MADERLREVWVSEVVSALGGTGGPTSGGAVLLLIGGLGGVAVAVSVVAHRWLPVSEVVAFLAIGVVLGPHGAGVLDQPAIAGLQPLTAVALGAMVFAISEKLRVNSLRAIRGTLLPMVLVGGLATFGVTFCSLLAAGLGLQAAYLLAAIAPSTAPVTVRALVAEKGARGAFTDHLLAATALNCMISAVLFGLGAPFVFATLGPRAEIVGSLAQLLGSALGIGLAAGGVMVLGARVVPTSGQRFLLVWVLLIATVGAALYVSGSVVIVTLVAGSVVANLARDPEPLFEQVRALEAPIILVFFVVTGADLDLERFLTLGIAGTVYVVARTVGRVGGSWLGLWLTRSGRALGWRHRAGLAQLPYAGMAVGLASFSVEQASQAGAQVTGESVAALILGSVFVFEVITPVLVDRALVAAGEADEIRDGPQGPAAAREREAVRHVLIAVGRERHVAALARAAISVAAAGRTAVTVLAVDTERTWRGRADHQPALAMFSRIAADHALPVNAVVRLADTLEAAIAAEVVQNAVDLVLVGESRHPERARQLRQTLAGKAEVMVVPTTASAAPSGPALGRLDRRRDR